VCVSVSVCYSCLQLLYVQRDQHETEVMFSVVAR
jgi:hypothetical protein